jgi:hypothetical protein
MRRRCNHELYEFYSDPDIMNNIKEDLLRLVGFLTRMDDGEPAKMYPLASWYGEEAKADQTLRWLEST